MNGSCADTEPIANATNFVGKSNLYCMERVIDEFCHLRRTVSRIEDRRLDSCVQLVKSRAPLPVLRPNNDLRWIEEVVDRYRFAQEFGVVDKLDLIE